MSLDETPTGGSGGHYADHAALRAEAAGRGVTIANLPAGSTPAQHLAVHNALHTNHNAIGAATTLPQNPTSGHLAHHAALHTAYNIRTAPAPSAHWVADWENGPGTGMSAYMGDTVATGWSVVQAEDASQANPALNSVVNASAEGLPTPPESVVNVGKFLVDTTAYNAGLRHSKVFKEWQIGGTTKDDDLDRPLQAIHASGISGTYRAWFYVASGYTYASQGWTNIIQFKLEEAGPFVQDPQWWVNITNDGGNVNAPHLHVENWADGTFTDPGGTKVMPKGAWFELRADLYEGDQIDWYLDGVFWQTVNHATHPIGRYPSGGGSSRVWIFGVGHYGGGGPIYCGRSSFTPF